MVEERKSVLSERKSVLETVRSSDPLGRLSERTAKNRITIIVITVVVLFGLIFLIAGLVTKTSRGTDNIKIPSVVPR